MNSTEQRQHTTRLDALRRDLEETQRLFTELSETLATTKDLSLLRLDLGDRIREQVGEECTHRLKLAEEQRSYVDTQDKRLEQRLHAFVQMTFWHRLAWLVFGWRSLNWGR